MEAIFSDWLNLILRWAHIVTGIAWIGSSFFFNWLDSHIEPPKDGDDKIEGNLWMVHSGGFYNMIKIQLAPADIPKTLHWVKWEAGFTWITGFFLLVLIYYVGASVYTMPSEPSGLGVGGTIVLGLATLIVAWFVYDTLWNSGFAMNSPKVAALISFLLMLLIAWGLTHFMSDRAAYLHVGAMMGTLMAANVWMRIIPSQRELVDATKAGRQPDKAAAERAKNRSVHNNYMTLPVLFLMISGHYAGTYGNDLNWLILGLLVLVGASIRHFFNLRNKGKEKQGLLFVAAGAAGMLLLLGIWLGQAAIRSDAGGDKVAFVDVRTIIDVRCGICHSAEPSGEYVDVAPKGVMYDTPEQIQARAAEIDAQSLQSDVMPPGNLTEMTDAEREILRRWIAQGAEID
ncbi:MAG: urate hydroxylase PuuD [Alphaproteobacteria bacterium]|nr:urate hydroxylase PuuD [Alphaproteobacteria bacterium]